MESDFSVFHRVSDMYALSAPRFFKLAERLSAYDGMMRARVVAAVAEEDGHRRAVHALTTGRPGMHADTYVPDAITPASVALDPVLGSLFSFGTPS